jgi:hypothetical protein
MSFTSRALAALLLVPLALSVTTQTADACACGCGVFEVATSSMFPGGEGGMLYYGFDYQDQSRNWSGGHSAPAANNADKQIRTYFNTLGVQYMFNRSWGVQVEVPIWSRTFKTDTNFGGDTPNVQSDSWTGLGDIRIRGIYTGFSEDMSTGVTYGLKLPTGNNLHNPSFVDPDTQLGTGSTDLLLGAFHRQALTADNSWSWFAQAQLEVPVLIQNQYRPGDELDLAVGVHYNDWSVGPFKVTPVAQIITAFRGRDSGANAASPVASGYQRLIVAPGIEIDYQQFSAYVDVEVPVLQSVNGNQLTAPFAIKAFIAYNF